MFENGPSPVSVFTALSLLVTGWGRWDTTLSVPSPAGGGVQHPGGGGGARGAPGGDQPGEDRPGRGRPPHHRRGRALRGPQAFRGPRVQADTGPQQGGWLTHCVSCCWRPGVDNTCDLLLTLFLGKVSYAIMCVIIAIKGNIFGSESVVRQILRLLRLFLYLK